MSEVLGFSASNTRVVTVTALQTSSPFFEFTLGTFSIPAFSSLCLLCGFFGLLGKLLATGSQYWHSEYAVQPGPFTSGGHFHLLHQEGEK